jgi:hypothetical protein
VTNDVSCNYECRVCAGAHPEFLIGGGGGADPEAIYNLFFILNIML